MPPLVMVHSTPNEIGPQGRQTIVLTFSPPVFHRHVLALDVAGFAQALANVGQEVRELVCYPGLSDPIMASPAAAPVRSESRCCGTPMLQIKGATPVRLASGSMSESGSSAEMLRTIRAAWKRCPPDRACRRDGTRCAQVAGRTLEPAARKPVNRGYQRRGRLCRVSSFTS
jgi:hypothetical protein